MALPSGNVRRWEWLADLCRCRGYTSGVELGVKEGRTTAFLLAKEPGLRLVAVDLWDLVPANDVEQYAGWNWNEIKEQFRSSTAPYAARLSFHQMGTLEAAKLYAKRKARFDFVFIDANHSFSGVQADIRAWRPLIRAGGTVCGHDIDLASVYMAVTAEFESWSAWKHRSDSMWWSSV